MAIRNQALETVGNNIFLCPVNEEHAVTCIIFCNYSASQVTINVHAVPNGVSAVNDSSIVIKELTLPASETFTFDTEKFVLSGGDRLHATASTDNAVTATVSSMRVS
jgi:hypothetical protein